MATKKISELEAITEADGSDALVIVDVSEGKTNKITKNNLLKGSGHTIEMSLNENYQIVLKLKNAEGTELSTATIDLPNENAITNISYSNGTLTLTKQSGVTSTVDISGLINGLATETALTNLANALKETIGIDTDTYDNTKTYNTGDIVVQNEKIYKANQDNITGTFDSSKWDEISLYEYQKLQDEAIEENYKVVTKLQEDVEDLTERMEDAENNQLTNTPEIATSHYLQDSADSRFRKFLPIGRTTQESDPTPENPVPIKNTGDNVNEFDITKRLLGTIDDNGDLVIDGTTRKFYEDDFDENIQYTLSGYVKSPSGTVRFKLFYTDGNSTDLVLYNGTDEYKYMTFTTPENKTLDYIAMYYGNVGKMYIKNAELKIEKGTKATPYSPYGCGNVNEKVQNKNLFDGELETGGISYKTGELEVDTAKIRTKNYIAVLPNTSYVFKRTTFPTDQIAFRYYGKNKEYLGYLTIGVKQTQVITTRINGNDIYYIKWVDLSNDLNATYQLEQGSTATDYTAHSEQNISFPLSQGQKFYEGSHPDDDEKVHHKRKQFTLDGSQLMSKFIYNSNLSTTNYSCFLYNDNEIKQATNDTEVFVLADKLKGTPSNQRTSDMANCWINHLSTGQLGMHVPNTITNTTELNTWLTENPITFEVPLAEETTEDFTEEQKTAWNQIKKARTYKNITHISSEDETPANVDIEYVVDINTIDDRITALEARVDLLEE